MRIRDNQPMHNRSHRSLSRTEFSLEKLAQKRSAQRSKTFATSSHLQDPLIKKRGNKILHMTWREEKLDGDKSHRSKSSRKALGIFKKAHQTNQNESYLQKVPKERVKIFNNNKQIRSIFRAERSEGIRTISSMDDCSPEQSQKNAVQYLKFQNKNFRSPEIKFRTINNHSYNKTYTPQEICISKNIVSLQKYQKTQINEISLIQKGRLEQTVNQQQNIQRIQQQEASAHRQSSAAVQITIEEKKVPTVKKQFRNYRREVQSITNQTSQKSHLNAQFSSGSKQEAVEIQRTNTAARHYQPSQMLNLDHLETIEPVDRIEKSLSKKKKEEKIVSPKKEYYQNIYSEVNQIDIEEIAFADQINQEKKKQNKDEITGSKDAKEQQTMKQSKDRVTWNGQLQRAKLQNNPYLPIQSNKKQNQVSNLEQNEHNSQKIKEDHLKEKNFFEKDEQSIPVQKQKANTNENHNRQEEKSKIMINRLTKDGQPQKQDQNNDLQREPVAQQKKSSDSFSNIKKQDTIESQNDKSNKKSIIMEILSKITKMHSKLEMLGELATYFSKNSKTFKRNQQSKTFLRNEGIQWHLMVYLFFKYFYYMLLLFSQYYKFSSDSIPIKKSQLSELKQENQKWLETLRKIEKSVKKHLKTGNYDESIFENPPALANLQDKLIVNDIVSFYFLQQKQKGNNEFCDYMKSLQAKINKQVTAYIKSMNLSNILNTASVASSVFQEATFRIFNSTIILYQLQNAPQSQISTCETIEELNSPQIERFKDYYQKLTKEILSKK